MTDCEVPINQELLTKVLAGISPDSVLVGGQALAFWVSHYGVQLPAVFSGAISDDADILGQRADVLEIAKRVHGAPELASGRVISALVGQVRIPVRTGEYVNVDVLHKLVGVEPDKVRERASEVTLGDITFLVMHPIDVLHSRIENLAKLKDKQTPQGIEQAKLSLLVANRYTQECAAEGDDGQRHATKVIEHIVSIAKSSAGRRTARDFGIDFLVALPVFAIQAEQFRTIRWPQILKELAKAAECA